jgi:hypothetical protein
VKPSDITGTGVGAATYDEEDQEIMIVTPARERERIEEERRLRIQLALLKESVAHQENKNKRVSTMKAPKGNSFVTRTRQTNSD